MICTCNQNRDEDSLGPQDSHHDEDYSSSAESEPAFSTKRIKSL